MSNFKFQQSPASTSHFEIFCSIVQILINCRCEDESDCQGQSNAIVHSSPDPKTNVTALWAPPSNMNGQEVTFVATIVERNDDKGSFWYENISTLPIAV